MSKYDFEYQNGIFRLSSNIEKRKAKNENQTKNENHIMTGNLKIISDSRIRYIVSKGPKGFLLVSISKNVGKK